MGLGCFLVEELRDRKSSRDHVGGVGILLTDPLLKTDRAQETPLVFEHGADAGVIGETGGDHRTIDEPGPLVLADVAVRLAHHEQPIKRNLERRIPLPQDLEHFHDLASVVERGLRMYPEEHAGQFALVVLSMFLEDRGEIFEGLCVVAVTEMTLAECIALADVHQVGIGRLFAGGEHGELGRCTD